MVTGTVDGVPFLYPVISFPMITCLCRHWSISEATAALAMMFGDSKLLLVALLLLLGLEVSHPGRRPHHPPLR